MRRPLPAGVKIKNAQKDWEGGEISLALKLSKGSFSTKITGTIKVSDKTVVLNCALPKLVTALVGEDKIKAAIEEQINGLFEIKSASVYRSGRTRPLSPGSVPDPRTNGGRLIQIASSL